MNDAELKRIALKIAKCLALANSDNAAEAETAKRQADALMAKYNLSSGDVAAANVHKKISKSGGKYNPPLYLCSLSNVVARAFGCGAVFQSGGGWRDSVIQFIGIGIKPELAAYTFDVLRRQLNNDRTDYSKTLKRFKRANKIRMADLFCNAWVSRVSRQVQEFAGSPADKEAIAAYKQQRFGGRLKTDDRTGHAPQDYQDYNALAAGRHAASDVSLCISPCKANAAKPWRIRLNMERPVAVTTAPLDDATLALLPTRVAELVDVVGLPAALKLVELRGGGRLEVPKHAKPEHWLVEPIGLEALTKLAAYYGGERIEVDRCVKVLRMIKERLIVAEFDSGLSNGQLARKHHYTERGIRILRKRVEKTQPSVNLDLFADFL